MQAHGIPTYITTHKRTNTHTKAISAPAAPAATVMAPGGELASTVRLPPTAPPARLPVAAVTAASIPVCSHIWAATQIIARSPNNMQRGVITNPNATVRKLIATLLVSGTASIAMKIGDRVFRIRNKPHSTMTMISRIKRPIQMPPLYITLEIPTTIESYQAPSISISNRTFITASASAVTCRPHFNMARKR